MTDCQLWEYEKEIILEYFEEDDLSAVDEANRCLDALKELETIIQPLSVEFRTTCRHLKRLFHSFKIEPEVPFWHWQISSVPPGVSTFGVYTGIATVVSVDEIIIDNLSKWIEKALQQKSPDPEYDINWSEMNIWSTRAKIVDEVYFIGRDYYLVETRIGEIKYPLRRHNDGLWVYGPQKPYSSYPPMSIKIYNHAGAHEMKFLIPWTVWYDESSPEYSCFYLAVQRIIAQGWQLSEETPMKEPKYAA